MEIENEKNNNNFSPEKSYQEKLNSTISSDTIKILSLLKSFPSTAASTSFHQDKNQNINSSNENNTDTNNNINNIENLSYEEIKAICLKVFMIYAKPINGQFYLFKRFIFQIMKEMEILSDNTLSSIDIEIIIQQVNKKGDKINSEQFLDFLAKICCLLDDNFYQDKKTSFIKLIKLYIGPYLKKKEKNEYLNDEVDNIDNNDKNKDIGNISYGSYEKINLNLNFKDLILNEYKLDKDSFDILMSIIEGLKIIYISYFSLSELSTNKDISKLHKDSFNIFINFLKDFGIIPLLLKQRLAELYWSIIISLDINELYKIKQNNKYENNNNDEFISFLNNKKYNIGKIYTFKKFFLLFSHISFYYYHSIKSKTQGQKLLYIIEKIYKSKGYKNMPNVYSKTFSRRYSIIPPFNIVERINKNILDNKKKPKLNQENYNYKYLIKNVLGLNEENYKLLDEYLEQLKVFFDIYGHIFDKYQYGKISFTNLQKMLSDGELLLINENIDNTKDKENNLKKTEKDKSEEIIIINKESLSKNDITLKDNTRYNNSNSNVLNSDNNENNQKNYTSLDNKKNNSNFQSTNSFNNKTNKKLNKPKLKLLDLNIIISKICQNPNLTENQNHLTDTFTSSLLNTPSDISNIINAIICYKIDFISFLKALCLISLKIYPNEKNDINLSMNKFLGEGVGQFLSNLTKKSLAFDKNNEINNLFELIKNDNIIQLMNDISPLIKSYFDFYTEINEKKEKICNFYSFVKFFKDYEIYPNWINISILSNIFYTQIFRISKDQKDFMKICTDINFFQFLECFVVIGLKMNSGDDFDMIDKVLFMIDKMFSDNYGKIIKKIKNLPSFKDDYFYYEKILKEKYPSYYERKYSNCNHRYDNKFFWVYEKNYGNDNFTQTQQIDFGELFNKEKIKFNDVFDDINNTDNRNQTYKSNEPINEIKE